MNYNHFGSYITLSSLFSPYMAFAFNLFKETELI